MWYFNDISLHINVIFYYGACHLEPTKKLQIFQPHLWVWFKKILLVEMILSMKGTKPQDQFLFGLKRKEIFITMWPNLATTIYTHYVMLLLVKNLFSSAALTVVALFVIQWNFDEKNAVFHSGLCTSHEHISMEQTA